MHGVRWLGVDGPSQRFTAGTDSAFSGTAIASRAGHRNPGVGAAGARGREFADIEDGPALDAVADLRRPGGASRSRALFPQVALGTSTTDAQAALFEFLLGHEPGSTSASDLTVLFQALEHDLLDVYERPGGTAEILRRLHQDGFEPHEGGTRWELRVRRLDGDVADAAPEGTELLRALVAADPAVDLAEHLATLNAAQDDLLHAERELAAWQRELYARWWKHVRGGAPEEFAPRGETGHGGRIAGTGERPEVPRQPHRAAADRGGPATSHRPGSNGGRVAARPRSWSRCRRRASSPRRTPWW